MGPDKVPFGVDGARRPPLWTVKELEEATNGVWLVPPPAKWVATGFNNYGRDIHEGDLAMTTQHPQWPKKMFSDTSKRIDAMFEAGAAAVIVEKTPNDLAADKPLYLVASTRRALDDLGRYARGRLRGKVILVTGSAGKTSTKDALGLVLARQSTVFAGKGNANTGFGVPMHLAQTPPRTAYAIYEVSVGRGPNPRSMAKLAKPHMAIITNVHEAHTVYVGSVEATARAKAEIFKYLEPGGTVVLNRDEAYFELLRTLAVKAGVERIVTFGRSPGADLRLIACELDPEGSDLEVEAFGKRLSYRVNIPGSHHAINSIGVLAGVGALGADVEQAAEDIKDFEHRLERRGQRFTIQLAAGEAVLIDDTGNATPASMRAAFEVMGLNNPGPGARRIAVLGDIVQMGADADRLHAELAEPLVAAGADMVFTVGVHMRHLHEALPKAIRGPHADSIDALIKEVKAAIRPGDVVLAKSGRLSNVSMVVTALLEEAKKGS